MQKKRLLTGVTLIGLGVLLSTLLLAGFGWIRPSFADIKLGAEQPPVNLNVDADVFSKAFIEVADKVTPSIVQINVVSKMKKGNTQDFFFFPFKGDESPETEGSGSGVIISKDGYILTNNHVVENATKVTVGLRDKRKLEAKVIGTDPLTDLAVIKIDAENLPMAYLGDSEKIKVGQWVMAIGNPMALQSTVTAGIISALNRGQLRLIADRYGVEDFIQTDAAINPGNSGGALVDLSGAVIGINTAIATRTGAYIGYGFAIPINLARSVAQDLIANGKVNRGYIGVQIREVDASLAKSLGLDKPTGVITEKIVEGGAAANEDIKNGDVILKIDNLEVSQPNQLQSYVASKNAGSKVKLTIFRDGKEITRTVTLKPKDDDSKTLAKGDEINEDKDEVTKNSINFSDVGLTVKNMTSQDKREYDVESGVLITKVENLSTAYNQGLGTGLAITKADKKNVASVSELKKIFDSKKGNAVLLVVVDKDGNSRFVGLEIPK